jgi:GTP-binding protein
VFVDEAKILVRGGNGGKGCLAFRREKFVPRGGPSGGDGGHGGSVILEANPHDNTLLRYRFNLEFKADSGNNGEGSNKTGRSGEDLILPVPVGTMVFDAASGEQLADLTEPGQKVEIAHGGHGGRGNGNPHFVRPWHRAPREHEEGRPGQEKQLRLELKLIADVGLVGFPNAGKSTLISRISAARPKIADYPFTTLEPHLGVVNADGPPGSRDGRTFVVADIPGLIEGAHEGAGLGIRFLRHIERTRLLAHLVDASDNAISPVEGYDDSDPARDFDVILAELKSFNPELAAKPMIVVATKIDAAPEGLRVARLRESAEAHGLPFFAISAVSGAGVQELVRAMADALDRLPRSVPVAASEADTDTKADIDEDSADAPSVDAADHS